MDHSVNVLKFAEARASEIASLMEEISACGSSKNKAWFQRMPHHMRRRNASQNPKRVPRKLRNSAKVSETKAKQSKNKKHKKKPKNIQEEYASRSTPDATWLETHIWHAKRFKMETLWNYRLPKHSNDKKIGTSHKAATNYCMILDLSYYCCIELVGQQDNLLAQLAPLSDASCGHTFASKMFLDGTKEGYTFLYHPHCYPYKAMGPITFLWEPLSAFSGYENNENESAFRKLWIWCHPSFHDELVEVLLKVFNFTETNLKKETSNTFQFCCKLTLAKTAPQFLKEKNYISGNANINMNLLKNLFARHRLIGPMSQQVLARVLKLANVGKVSCDKMLQSENDNPAKRFKSDATIDSESTLPQPSEEEITNREEIDHYDGKLDESKLCSVSSLESKKLWWESYYGETDNAESHKSSYAKQACLWNTLKEAQASYFVTPRSVIGLTVRDPRIEAGWKGKDNSSNSHGKFKHHTEFEELFSPPVSVSPLWDADIRNEVTMTKLPESFINEERSKCIVTPDFGRKESRVPIMLIHQPGLNGFGSGWDVIVPLGWSLEFWRCYERCGGTPAGLRDLHFINFETGRPNFPCSFPDTAAGSAYEEMSRHDSLTILYKRPKSQRPNFSILATSTPYFMCWKTLISDWVKELPNIISELSPSPDNSILSTSCSKNDNDATSNSSSENSIIGKEFFVLRNTFELSRLCDRLNRTPRNSGAESEKLKELVRNFLITTLKSQTQLSKSLILIKIKCLNKGVPSKHAGIYLLNDEDLTELRNNSKFCGPTEPHHAAEKDNKSKSKGKEDSENDLSSKMENKGKSDNLERPIIQSLISNTTRKMIGYVSEGGFSSISGHGFGIGHCSYVGFLVMLKQCVNAHLRPLILWKEQHNFKYRIANVDVIEHYL